MTAATKRLIDELARNGNRTQSQQCEDMIEKCLQYDRMLESMRTTMADMEKQNVDAALFRLGYAPIRDDDATEGLEPWLEPGYPARSRDRGSCA